jgi:hypothetical protein
MIRAGGKSGDGRPILFLGLSRANCDRLLDDQPIAFDASAFGFDGRIVLVAGESEETITRQLRAAGVAIHTGHPN